MRLGLGYWLFAVLLAGCTAAPVQQYSVYQPTPTYSTNWPSQVDQSQAAAPIRVARYGSCDCPYDFKSNGAQCGASSAWSRPGGTSPQCYSTDPSPQPSFTAPHCAENGSCYGDISSITGRPKTVAVRGYYRKDGTYVRGHYRSKR